jgi:hypothetical protein
MLSSQIPSSTGAARKIRFRGSPSSLLGFRQVMKEEKKEIISALVRSNRGGIQALPFKDPYATRATVRHCDGDCARLCVCSFNYMHTRTCRRTPSYGDGRGQANLIEFMRALSCISRFSGLRVGT